MYLVDFSFDFSFLVVLTCHFQTFVPEQSTSFVVGLHPSSILVGFPLNHLVANLIYLYSLIFQCSQRPLDCRELSLPNSDVWQISILRTKYSVLSASVMNLTCEGSFVLWHGMILIRRYCTILCTIVRHFSSTHTGTSRHKADMKERSIAADRFLRMISMDLDSAKDRYERIKEYSVQSTNRRIGTEGKRMFLNIVKYTKAKRAPIDTVWKIMKYGHDTVRHISMVMHCIYDQYGRTIHTAYVIKSWREEQYSTLSTVLRSKNVKYWIILNAYTRNKVKI